MNLSYHWLQQYINIHLPVDELAEILTSIGLEVDSYEEISSVKGGLEGLVIGEVLTCQPHENSDHLFVTTVNIGEVEPLQIVCGAPNVAAGQKVVVAPVGTKLYAGEETFIIKRSKIRGVESYGMICAEDEIGIGTSHEGIIVLPNDAIPGTPAKEYYKIETDVVFEIDLTPNRADATSHFGVARDLAAYFSIRDKAIHLIKPSVENFKVQNQSLTIPVIIENTEACKRYSAVTISGVKIKESPQWLQNYLKAIGIRPINNVVDITNFVLYEIGQPLHAFDADKIKGGKVIVKNLPEGTTFITLDGVERKLSAEDLMICNVEEPMCIGGVFGGLNSGVTETTQNIFIESAYFNPVSIRKTARRHGLNTDASFRFERGCDPENTIYALKRCALLIQEIAGGEISSEIIDVYPKPIRPAEVRLLYEKIDNLIGEKIERSVINTILRALEIRIIEMNEEGYYLRIPLYRVDVQRDVDVIEDILRIYGYNRVEITERIVSTLSHWKKPDTFKLQNIISEQLTSQGFNEVVNNSLTKSSYYVPLYSFPLENCVKILNPLSSDLSVMRQTMLFGGLENIIYNIHRQNFDLKFYEFGNCYFYFPQNKRENDILSPYREEFHLALWLTGNKHSQSWTMPQEKTTVFELKAYIENIFLRLGIKRRQLHVQEFSDDLLSKALVYLNEKGKKIGIFGIVHSNVLKKFDIEQEVYYADLDWNLLLALIKNHKISFTEIPKFPEVRRDLALLLDKNINFSEIEKIAYETERKLLKRVQLFDVYEGENIAPGKKSYAVSFILQDETKTLTDDQIDAIMKKLMKNFAEKLGAQLRNK